MNITCDPPQPSATPTFMGGGRRSRSPDPPFRTDYSFATADAGSDVDAHWDVVDAPHDFISECVCEHTHRPLLLSGSCAFRRLTTRLSTRLTTCPIVCRILVDTATAHMPLHVPPPWPCNSRQCCSVDRLGYSF